MTMLNHQK